MKRVAAVAFIAVALVVSGGFLLGGSSQPVQSPPMIYGPTGHFVGLFGGPPPASPAIGDVLTTSNGKWSGSPTSFAYAWQDCNSSGGGCVTAAGSPTNTGRYVIAPGDVGFTIEVAVTATYSGGQTGTQSSAPTGVVSSGSGSPLNSVAPKTIDATLLSNYEVPDTVQASAGTWTNSPTSYTYQFQDCTGISGSVGTGCQNINTPQCSATAATTCTYSLGVRDTGNYIVAAVTATNGSGSSTPVTSAAVGQVVPSRVNTFCNIPTAYNNQTTGAHLCGWPDSTNTGYTNAPGYPGSLTVASAGSPTCPTVPLSNHTYSFCQWAGMSIPGNLTNVTFYGSAFKRTNPQNENVIGGSGDNNIVFDYDSFIPAAVASPPATCAQSYQYGINDEGGAMKGYTVSHSDFWGFGNAIDTSGSTQANPQIFKYNWIHDVVNDSACGYHTDGIGYEGGTTGSSLAENYAVTDHNNIQLVGNTQSIAWQEGTYDHKWDTNNLLGGLPYSVARCTGACTVQYSVSTGNTFSTYLSMSCCSTIDGTSSPWAKTGGVWQNNFWAVPPGAAYGTSVFNGDFWTPAGNSNIPADCGWVSLNDWPNYGNLCTAGGVVPANTTQPYFVASTASGTDGTCSSGCAIQGQQVTVQHGAWSNNPSSYSYQWQDCTTTPGTDTGVAVTSGGASNNMTPPTTASCSNAAGTGATTSTYTVGAGDVGKALAVHVTATNSHGSTTTSSSGSCNTGLMTTTWTAATNSASPLGSTFGDNGQPGCSPISAVVGTSQYGTTTTGQHFCTNAPTTCGFADVANAGVPLGTALYTVPGTCTSPTGPNIGCNATGSGWSYAAGQITLTTGAVLQNVSFASGANTNNTVVFAGGASNVTIQDSDISDGCNCQFQVAGGVITLTGSGSNITIRNNNLHGIDAVTAGHGCNAGVFGGLSQTNITVANNNIYFCATGMNQVTATNGGWNINGNYIHDFAWGDSARSNHFDGIQFEGGGSANALTSFVNNTDLADISQTDAIILSDDFSPPTNSYRWIVHNLVAGGSLAVYVSGDPAWPTLNSTFKNDDYSQIYMGDHNTRSQFGSAAYGSNALWTPSTNVWTGNVWDDTGGTVAPDACTGVSPNFCP